MTEQVAEVEPDEDELDDEEASEPEAAVAEVEEPQEPSSEAQMEENLKNLESARKSFSTRVSSIMGDDAVMLQPCPLCWPFTQGFVMPGSPMPDEQKAVVKALIGEGGQAEYLDDPARETCPQCDGLGMLKTGSKVQGQDALNCRRCNGHGFIDKVAVGNVANGETNVNVTQAWPTVATPGTPPPPDQWGRPFGHPHFGQNPATVGT